MYDPKTGLCDVIITKIETSSESDFMENASDLRLAFKRITAKAKIQLKNGENNLFSPTEGTDFSNVQFDLTQGDYTVLLRGVSDGNRDKRIALSIDGDDVTLYDSRHMLLAHKSKKIDYVTASSSVNNWYESIVQEQNEPARHFAKQFTLD